MRRPVQVRGPGAAGMVVFISVDLDVDDRHGDPPVLAAQHAAEHSPVKARCTIVLSHGHRSASHLAAKQRWHPIELAFWLATLLPFVLVPTYLTLASQIAITAIFAVSLDLIMGYAGLVSLGHAAYFGLGAYTAGLIAKAGWGEPFSGLLIAARRPGCSAISPPSSSRVSATWR